MQNNIDIDFLETLNRNRSSHKLDTHTHTHTHTHTRTYINTQTLKHKHLNTHTHTQTHTQALKHTHTTTPWCEFKTPISAKQQYSNKTISTFVKSKISSCQNHQNVFRKDFFFACVQSI